MRKLILSTVGIISLIGLILTLSLQAVLAQETQSVDVLIPEVGENGIAGGVVEISLSDAVAPKVGDLTCDGNITISDAIEILNIILGINNEPECDANLTEVEVELISITHPDFGLVQVDNTVSHAYRFAFADANMLIQAGEPNPVVATITYSAPRGTILSVHSRFTQMDDDEGTSLPLQIATELVR